MEIFGEGQFRGIQPRNFIHELDGVDEGIGMVCLGLYCELNNRQGEYHVKAKITLRDENDRPRLNFDFPITPVVHYTNG